MADIREINLRDTDIVCTYDPARSRLSEYKNAARHAIVTTAMDEEYRVFVLNAWAYRGSLDKVLEHLEWTCSTFNPRVVGVETVAAQSVIADIVDVWLRLNRNLAPLADLNPDVRFNKKWRIKMQLQRVAPYGRLYFLENQIELRQEYFAFPNGRTIDLMDALAYNISLHNPPESEEKQFTKRDAFWHRLAASGMIPQTYANIRTAPRTAVLLSSAEISQPMFNIKPLGRKPVPLFEVDETEFRR